MKNMLKNMKEMFGKGKFGEIYKNNWRSVQEKSWMSLWGGKEFLREVLGICEWNVKGM